MAKAPKTYAKAPPRKKATTLAVVDVPAPIAHPVSTESPGKMLLRTSREFAIYVCSTRAIPSIEDGLKFGQRIGLWLLRNRAEKVKTFALSGLMGYERLYVHGETSANNTISLLAAPYKNNVPLITGHGQFGSRIAPVEGIGAPRYTEVARSKAAEAFIYNDLDLVPLEDNYDGSNKQPKHFLPLIPAVLLNGVSGVAVGWSTEILPRDYKDLVQATIDTLDDKTIKTLVPYYENYDITVKSTGKNQWQYTGKAEIVDTSNVHITELPPGEKLEKFRAKLIDMEEKKLIVGFTDRSSEKIDIMVRFKRGSLGAKPASTETQVINGKNKIVKIPASKGWTTDDAVAFFKLTEKVTERIVLVNWGGSGIRTYDDPAPLIKDYVDWRLGWYVTRYEKYKADDTYELAYWKALEALFADKFTTRLGKFENKAAVEEDVAKVTKKAKITVDADQIGKIVSLPTYRWTKDFEVEIQKRITELTASIAEYTDILASPDRRKAIYRSELEALKKLKF